MKTLIKSLERMKIEMQKIKEKRKTNKKRKKTLILTRLGVLCAAFAIV